MAADPITDVGFVRWQRISGLTPITLGTSGNLRAGRQVLAVGSPPGLDGTVTTSIISALNRPVATMSDTADQRATLDAFKPMPR